MIVEPEVCNMPGTYERFGAWMSGVTGILGSSLLGYSGMLWGFNFLGCLAGFLRPWMRQDMPSEFRNTVFLSFKEFPALLLTILSLNCFNFEKRNNF